MHAAPSYLHRSLYLHLRPPFLSGFKFLPSPLSNSPLSLVSRLSPSQTASRTEQAQKIPRPPRRTTQSAIHTRVTALVRAGSEPKASGPGPGGIDTPEIKPRQSPKFDSVLRVGSGARTPPNHDDERKAAIAAAKRTA
jgi:hypothetical protein